MGKHQCLFCYRECSYYDHNIYPVHGAAILEDLIITLADAMASMYLELISVDSDISEKISNSGLSLCTLSTRALQKLRNEVSFFSRFYFVGNSFLMSFFLLLRVFACCPLNAIITRTCESVTFLLLLINVCLPLGFLPFN